MKPTNEISSALEGAQLDTLSAASLSALRFTIYKIACKVLDEHSNRERRRMIEAHPKVIQALLRAECRRLYDHRRKKANN